MGNPTIQDRHISRALTNISIAHAQSTGDFVARKVFPVIPVESQYDQFHVYEQADYNRIQMKLRAPSTESAEAVFRLSKQNYSVNVFGLHKDIDDQERANADSVFQLDNEATTFLTDQRLIKEEYDFAAKYMAASVWGTTITGVAAAPGAGQVLQWNDPASTPIEDISTGRIAIMEATGQKANKLLLGAKAWESIKRHPDFIDLIKYGGGPGSPALLQRAALAAILEIDEVLVMDSVVNTAAEGQTASQSFITGKSALLVHAAKVPGRMTPSAGYTFEWRTYLGGTSGTAIKKFRLDAIESDRIEIKSAYVQQITSAPLGYYWTTIVA